LKVELQAININKNEQTKIKISWEPGRHRYDDRTRRKAMAGRKSERDLINEGNDPKENCAH
jgi:hypothetical protein